MTKPKTPAASSAAAPAPELEQPTRGGSYIRKQDGSLELVEETIDAVPDGEPASDTSGDTPGDAGNPEDEKSEG